MNKLITDKIRVHLEKTSKDKTVDQRKNAIILAKALEEIQAVKGFETKDGNKNPVKNVKSYLSIFGRLLKTIEELGHDAKFKAMFDVFLGH